MAQILQKLMEIIDILLKPLSWIALKLEDQYDRTFRYIAQTIFVISLAIIIFSPIVIYLILIFLQLQPPYCYIGFSSWLAYIIFIILVGLYAEYRHQKELIKSLLKENRYENARHLDEYLQLLRKKEKPENS